MCRSLIKPSLNPLQSSRLARLLLFLVLFGALPAYLNHAGAACSTSSIASGSTLSGSLTSSDCDAPHRPGSKADLYTFSASAGQQATISLDSSAFDTYVVLVGPSGTVVAQDDDSGPGLNSLISNFTLPTSGTYTVEATSYSFATGSYTVSLSLSGSAACSTFSISPGSTVGGSLTSSDCDAPHRPGSKADLYTFSGSGGQHMTIALNSSAFDSYLILLGPSGVVVAQDDDSGGNLNSLISNFTLPSSGTYTIEATSFSSATGAYVLSLTVAPPTITTSAATGVTSTSAVLSGTINPNGSTTTGWFEWGTTNPPGISSGIQNIGSGTNPVAYSQQLSGLTSNTIYYFRAVGQGGGGTIVRGNIVSFTTAALPDLVIQNLVVNPTSGVPGSGATISFAIRNQGGDTANASTTNIRLAASSTNVTTSDPPLALGINIPTLAPNATFNVSQPVTIPSVSPGNYFVWVIADVNSTAGQGAANELNDKVNTPFAVTNRPPTIGTQSQIRADTGAIIFQGGTIPEGVGVIFRAPLSDPDGDNVRLEVELRQVSEAFQGAPTSETISSFVSSGSTASTPTRFGLVSGSYKWKARAADNRGGTSAWGPAGNPDFVVMACITPSAPTVSGPTTSTFSETNYTVSWNSVANATRYLIQESTSSSFTSFISSYVAAPSTSKQFSHSVTSDTTYYYRVIADNEPCSLNSGFSNTVNVFVTTPPTATTGTCQVNGPSSALLFGTVNPNGSSTNAWFQWGLTTAYGNETAHQDIGAGTSTVQLTPQISGLSPNTSYHFRIVGQNSGGTSTGNDLTCVTPPPPTVKPTVSTGDPSNLASTFATVNGMVNPNGAPLTTWFEWGTSLSLGNTTAVISYGGSGTQDIPFSEHLTGLVNGTTYYHRVVAQNTAGRSEGVIKSFTHGLTSALGTQTPSGHSRDPVNTATGNYSYQRKDLEIPGKGLPFQFIRSYNSRDPKDGPLAFGWTHNFNVTLSELTDQSQLNVTVRWGDGRTEIYTENGSGQFIPQPGIFDTLIQNGDGTYTLRKKDLTSYNFDSSQRIASIVDKNGNTIALGYSGDNLSNITDTAGRIVSFDYDGNNRIASITDPTGRTLLFGYNASGDLISATDPNGNTTNYNYDSDHLLLSIVDPRGNPLVTNVYDAATRMVTTQIDAKGGPTTFSYDLENKVSSFVDALGHTTTHYYGDFFRLIRETDARGNSIFYTYDAAGNRTAVTDKNGNTTSYTYDAKGNVLTKTDPLNNVTTITYDANNNPLSRTDGLAKTTTFTYDANSNLISVKDSLNNTTTYTYDANGSLLTVTDARGNVTTNTYDAQGNLIRVTDALSNRTDSAYDGVGRKLTVTDALNKVTQFTYDANGNVLSITDASGGITQYTYDGNNNRLTVRDPRGNTTSYTYDAKDLLTKTTDPLGGAQTIAYDALDRKIATTDKNGNTTGFAYHPVGNLTQITDPLGKITAFTYDANGNRLTATDANGNVSSSTYDQLNRVVSQSDPLGNTMFTTFDALGRVVSTTNPKGQTTALDYDALGRLLKVTDANGGQVIYTYDANGNRLSLTEPNGNTTTFAYDPLNRLITKTEPLGTITTYTYDAVGNRIKVTDPKANSINYAYDALRRLATISYPDSTSVASSYDANGNRTQMVDSLGTSTYLYDALNRMTSYTNPFGKTVGYGYDSNGNRKTLTYPDGKVVTYAYDALNRLVSVKDWLNRTTAYIYDNVSRLTTAANPNGTSATYSYDNASRIVGLTNAKSDATVVSSYNFTLDQTGNHTQAVVNEPLLPNLTPQVVNYTYDDESRLTNAGGVANTFDANGNMTARGTSLFSYDFEDRLVQTTIGGVTAQYGYDGTGNRLARIDGGTTKRFVLDINGRLSNVLAETDQNGNITSYYVYGFGVISKILPDGTPTYYHYDSRGSTVALTDAAQTVTDAYAYDPFGTLANSSGTTQNAFKYVGRYGLMDEGNGISFIRARYYDSNLGRFVSKDTMMGKDGASQSLNRYVYALNNPTVLIDIDGRFVQVVWGAAFGGLFGVTGVLIDDVVKSASTQSNQFSSPLEYGIAFVSGAVGGFVTAGMGSVALGLAAQNATSQGLEILSSDRESFDLTYLGFSVASGLVLDKVSGSFYKTPPPATNPITKYMTGKKIDYYYVTEFTGQVLESAFGPVNVSASNSPVIPEQLENQVSAARVYKK